LPESIASHANITIRFLRPFPVPAPRRVIFFTFLCAIHCMWSLNLLKTLLQALYLPYVVLKVLW
jgi:hypothetical protein